MTITTQTRRVRHASSALLFSGVAALLSACGGSSSSGGGNTPETEPTLRVTQENAAELMLQSRIALEFLPRLQRNANILISNGFRSAPEPPCGNPEGQFTLIVDDNFPVSATLDQCQDPSYTSRTFDGRIDFNFSNPDLPYSRFVEFSNHIDLSDRGVLLELDGAFSIRPEDPVDHFGIALIEDTWGIARSTVTGERAGDTLEMEYLGFNVRFHSNVHFDEVPFPTLGGGGALALGTFDDNIVMVSTPEYLIDPQENALCYGTGILRVEGLDGSYAEWRFDDEALVFIVNGETLESEVCAAQSSQPGQGPGSDGGVIRR